MHQVTISNGSEVTVPVFDVKAVLLSILHDSQRMSCENFALNYDIFLGKPTQPVTHYNEIHTAIYGQLLVIITAVMIQIHFCWVWSDFMTKLIMMHLVHYHVLLLLLRFHFST